MATARRTGTGRPRAGTPKLLVPGPPPGFEAHSSGLLHPQLPKGSDIGQPHLMRQAVNNLVGIADRATPREVEEGRTWYPKVHDATAKGVKQFGLESILHGAGVVAGVSPNMDFEENNIHAFHEMHQLRQNPEHMAALHRSLGNMVHVRDKKTGEPKYLKDGSPKIAQTRTAEWQHIVTKHYPGIAAAPDANILKSHRIMEGEHPDLVLDPRTAPKTNSFAHNIADPSATVNPHTGHALATIDGRQHDLATNTMHAWQVSRGIGSSALKTGATTRYEHFANATAQAGQVMGAESSREVPPSEAQARVWVVGKRMELEMPGAKRKKATGLPYQGPNRTGQPYLP